MACAASVGPGSSNMVTGAAVATVNRLPVLLLPSDYFANRVPDPVLQQVEHPSEHDLSINDIFRPVSRVLHPHQQARAAAARAARGDAGADRPRRDRRGHPVAARGRPGRSLRLAAGAVRRAHLEDSAPAAGTRPRLPGGGAADARRESADRGRRRRQVQPCERCPGRLRRRLRHPGRGDPGRQGGDSLGPPDERGRTGRHRRHRRQPARRSGRRGAGGGYPPRRLRDRLEDHLPARDAGDRPQRERDGRPQAVRPADRRRRPARARGAGDGPARGAGTPAPATPSAAGSPSSNASGTASSTRVVGARGRERPGPGRGHRHGQRDLRWRRHHDQRRRQHAWRPGQAVATQRSPRAITSSTATPAWVTRSLRGSG